MFADVGGKINKYKAFYAAISCTVCLQTQIIPLQIVLVLFHSFVQISHKLFLSSHHKMMFITLAALTAVASAAPSVEPHSTFTQWFSDAVAQPEAFKPNNLTFSFGLSFTDGTHYDCFTY